jgi:hypothetical protein
MLGRRNLVRLIDFVPPLHMCFVVFVTVALAGLRGLLSLLCEVV